MPAVTTTTTTDRAARAIRARAEVSRRAAQWEEPLPFGRALFNSQAPRWYDLNHATIEAPVAAAEADAVRERVEAAQRTLPHRCAEAWDAATGTALAPAFRAAGWAEEGILLMGLEGEPPAAAEPAVEEVAPREVAALRMEWLELEAAVFRHDLALRRQAEVADAIVVATTPTRAFVVRAGGRPVSMALLYGGEPRGTALVDDVFTSPPARGRGLGAAVVGAALRAGVATGADLVALPAEAQGRALGLYRRLGLRDLALVRRWTREPR